MTEDLDRDVDALREWISGAWRQLADSSLTVFDRREVRNTMKEAEIALRIALKRMEQRRRTQRQAHISVSDVRSIDFRILQLEA